jgi:hypothetical protein
MASVLLGPDPRAYHADGVASVLTVRREPHAGEAGEAGCEDLLHMRSSTWPGCWSRTRARC